MSETLTLLQIQLLLYYLGAEPSKRTVTDSAKNLGITKWAVTRAMDAMEKQPDMPVRIIGGEAGMPLCPACQQHCGRVLAARSPQWTRHLPPFGIGCPLSLRPLSDTDDGETPTAAPGRDAATPEGILCQCFADNPQHALSRFLARWEVPPDAHGAPSRET